MLLLGLRAVILGGPFPKLCFTLGQGVSLLYIILRRLLLERPVSVCVGRLVVTG